MAPASAPSAPYRQEVRRVLIVDDSVVARAALTRMFDGDAGFAVAAAVSSAGAALSFLAAESVDLVLLDLDMPGTSGLDALPALIAAGRGARVVVVSGAAADGAAATVSALSLGAADTIAKPAPGALAGRFGALLRERLSVLASGGAASTATCGAAQRLARFDAIAIGASTGGIHALSSLLGQIPPVIDQPIFVTQHLPATFSDYFAVQVGLSGRRPCTVAVDRGRVRAGAIQVAPGNAHMVAMRLSDGGAATRLSTAPSATGNVPSVDTMFASLAALYGSRLLAIVLSGMGRDGLEGARAVRAAGGTVLVQDRDSSVVWGMPGVVADAGLAHAMLPPAQIGAVIARSRKRP